MTIGKTPARGEQTYWINGKYNWVSISDMVDGGTISTTNISRKTKCSTFAKHFVPKSHLLTQFKM